MASGHEDRTGEAQKKLDEKNVQTNEKVVGKTYVQIRSGAMIIPKKELPSKKKKCVNKRQVTGRQVAASCPIDVLLPKAPHSRPSAPDMDPPDLFLPPSSNSPDIFAGALNLAGDEEDQDYMGTSASVKHHVPLARSLKFGASSLPMTSAYVPNSGLSYMSSYGSKDDLLGTTLNVQSQSPLLDSSNSAVNILGSLRNSVPKTSSGAVHDSSLLESGTQLFYIVLTSVV